MGRIILFDGGAAGGLYIGSGGVRPIPPFSPSVLAHLRAVSDLLRATATQSPQTSHEMSTLTNKVSNLAIERIEAAIGPLDAQDSLVYLTEEDGFICGSTGAPPRPIGWPPNGLAESMELAAGKLLAPDLLQFLRLAPARGIKIVDLLEDPAAAADAIKVRLSTAAADSLRQLAPSRISAMKDPVDRELVGFLHAVIRDGRYLETWSTEPVATAKAIGVELSTPAVDKILGGSAIVGRVGDVANMSIEQGIVVGIVAVVLVVADNDPRFQGVVDRSSIDKF